MFIRLSLLRYTVAHHFSCAAYSLVTQRVNDIGFSSSLPHQTNEHCIFVLFSDYLCKRTFCFVLILHYDYRTHGLEPLSEHCAFVLQVADETQKRKKGIFGTKGGDKEVSLSDNCQPFMF